MSLPRSIWALGLVSLFMDISSEMIHGLLPVFLVSVIGANAVTVGLIEGLGESIALITRVFSGALSDWLQKRKFLVLVGYSLATLTKPLFAMANTAGMVLTARGLDRVGKGIRGAPRDALVADLAPEGQRGDAFGLRQSLDSLGAFIGPLLAVLLMAWTADNFRAVFWLALIPGVIAVTIIITLVREPAPKTTRRARAPIRRAELRRLSRDYWLVLLVAAAFTLARFSEAFLLLRADDLGLSVTLTPLILVTMSLVYALGAWPVGRLSDRIGRSGLLGRGILILVAADLVLATAVAPWQVALGAALWGLHMAFTQGLFAALVADTAPPQSRGTAFGLFGLITGAATLLASVIAGLLWDHYGAPATFLTGIGLALVSLMALRVLRKPPSRLEEEGV